MTVYKFDEFVLTKDNILMKNCTTINLSPKESGVLRLLLENAGHIVSKEKICQDVWHGGIVSDESLTRCLYILRKRLGENSEIKYIDTIYGKGYRFMVSVQTLCEKEQESTQKAEMTAQRVALLPFMMSDYYQTLRLHEKLFEYSGTSAWHNISFMPALMYAPDEFQQSLQSLLRSRDYQYILFGREVMADEKRVLRLELIKSADHAILGLRTLELSDCINRNGEILRHSIEMLVRRLSARVETSLPHQSSGSLIVNFQKVRASNHYLSSLQTPAFN